MRLLWLHRAVPVVSGTPLLVVYPGERSRLLRYGVAVIAVTLVALLKVFFVPLNGDEKPFLLFLVAVLASASYGGVGSGLLATTLALLASDYAFLTPGTLFALPGNDLLRLGLFALEGAIISVIGGAVAAAQRRAAANLAELHHQRAQLRQHDERFRGTFEQAAVGIAHMDLEGRWVLVNRKLCDIVGYTHAELQHLSFQDITHPDDLEADLYHMQRLLRGEIQTYAIEKRYIHRDGSFVWINLTASLVRTQHGEPAYVIAVVEDIRHRKQFEHLLRQSEERYRAFISQSSEAIWRFELAQPIPITLDVDEQIKRCYRYAYLAECNDAMARMYGYTHAEDLIGTPLDALLPRTDPNNIAYLRSFFRSGYQLADTESSEIDGRGKSKYFLNSLIGIVENGMVVRAWGMQRDITEHKQAEETLRRHALYDGLTGLPNRALFMDRLQHVLDRSSRYTDNMFAVLFLDMDRFKRINDTLGHVIGDKLLAETARRLAGCVRTCDTVARLGGDEFLVLLEELSGVRDAVEVAERILSVMSEPFLLDGHQVAVTPSIGIAIGNNTYADPGDVVRDADAAMYQAKARGKARYELFDEVQHAAARCRLQLENDLQRAIAHNELVVHYQPIVALRSGLIVGFEALVRWQHPKRGLVSPAEFIQVAEETGLIVPLGEWVLRTACQRLQTWQTMLMTDQERHAVVAPLFMSVNLSPRQLEHRGLCDTVQHILHDTGVDPRQLTLEITESAIMNNPEQAAGLLQQLRALGIAISMDDFGTGYSSLSYLHRFPLTSLKIDRSFVHGMETNTESVRIVEAIMGMARSLSLTLVAEGIETQAQLAHLQALDGNYGQGYMFSAPVPDHVVPDLLRSAPARCLAA